MGAASLSFFWIPDSIPPAASGLILVGAETGLYFSSRRGYFLEGCDRRA